MPCFLSCKSRSVLAKPLEHQCSLATISPGLSANSVRISPPHVPCSKLFRSHAALWTGATYFQVSRTVSMMHRVEHPKPRLSRGVQDLQHMRNAVVRLRDPLNARPELAALGDEVVVRINHQKRCDLLVVGVLRHGLSPLPDCREIDSLGNASSAPPAQCCFANT